MKEVKNKKKEIEEEEEEDDLVVKRTKKVKNNKDNLAENKEEKTVKYVKKQSSIKTEDEMKVKEEDIVVKEEDVVVKKEEVDMEEETKIEDVTIDEFGNEDGYVVKKRVSGVRKVKKEVQETIIEEVIKIEETEQTTPSKRVTRSNSKRSNN